VKAIEIWQGQEHLAPERLQTAASIAGAIAQDRLADRVGDARLDFFEPGILAADPLAGSKTNALTALLDCRDLGRQESRIVLAVSVERRHNGGPRSADSSANGCRLAG